MTATPAALAILGHADTEYHRDLVRGAAQHAHARQRPVAYLGPAFADERVQPAVAEALDAGRFAAAVVQHHPSAELGALLAAAPIPVVAVTGRPPGFRGPVVQIDDAAHGAAAAAHLLACNLRAFAFVGYDDAPWALAARDGFAARLAAAGHHAEHFPINRRHHGGRWTDALPGWLRARGPGIGVLCQNDRCAVAALAACAAGGLAVPEDVALMGTDNERFLCETASPALTSVRPPGYAVGHAAAALAERLLAGEALGALDQVLPPLGVAVRGSTGDAARDDAAVARALHFIRLHWREDLAIGRVAAAAGVSRRVLERRFVRTLQRSPLDEIRRHRIEHAKRLLVETGLTLDEIARESGMSGAKRLCTVFKQVTGETPGGFRQRAQAG